MKAREFITEAWSQKYKSSINCSHPKGFSQKAHCAGKKKQNESVEMEMVCEMCGMCETHGDHSRANLNEKCWDTHKQVGMKNKGGRMVPNCVAKESVTEDDVAAFVARGGEIQQLKPQRGPKRAGVSLASKHIGSGSGRGTTKGKVSGLGANTGKSGKPVVTAEQGVAEGQQIDEVFADQGSGSTDRDNAEYMKRRRAAKNTATRGIGLPSAPTKKFFTRKKQWSQTVDDINHLKYDDNSEYTGMTGRSTVSIDGREWARWSDAQQKGYIELSSMSEQGVAEGIDTEELADEVYAEFERIYPNLARRANERTVHAAIMDVLNYGGDNDPGALAQDVARAVKRDMQQDISEGICSLEEAHEIFDDFEQAMAARGLTEDVFETITDEQIIRETAAWRRKAGKSAKGGLNRKGVASYRRENPGSKLQMAVTTKPSKLKPGSKSAKRRKSFCARMSGVKGPMKKPNGKPTRKALALRKWNC